MLGEGRFPGHRFFFALDEVEPLGGVAAAAPAPARILVAGIGNIFLGDDGFGVEVARRLAERERAPGVDVVDFGIRGMDLAYALQGYDAVVFVDAAPRGERPGTLSVVQPDPEPGDVADGSTIPTNLRPPRRARDLPTFAVYESARTCRREPVLRPAVGANYNWKPSQSRKHPRS